MKKIGITGGSGLLGKLLIQELKKKKIAYSLFKKDITSKKNVISWLTKDENIEYIFHFAAYTSVKNSNRNKTKAFKVNVLGTDNLLKAINFLKKENYIFSSSSHVYNYSNKPIKENYRKKPVSYYGKTKLLAEKRIINNKGNYCKYCIARIFSIYHVNQKKPFLYPSIKHKLKKIESSKVYIDGANNIRDFLNADKVIRIILKIFDKKLVGVYNIGCGKGMTVKKFINKYIDKKRVIIDNKISNSLVANISKIKKKIL